MKVRIYTDGACSENPGPGGWAIAIGMPDGWQTKSGMSLSTTNNRMELRAVIEALQTLCNVPSVSEFEIHSDSAYVINAISKGWLLQWQQSGWQTKQGHDVKNKDLWCTILESLRNIEQRGLKVAFVKVKGHSGNTFNERVDQLAREQSVCARALLEQKRESAGV